MSRVSSSTDEKQNNESWINDISALRQDVLALVQRMNELLAEKPNCIAEMTLSKRELQSARHWLGECLSYYPTGYTVTDQPNKPETFSKAS